MNISGFVEQEDCEPLADSYIQEEMTQKLDKHMERLDLLMPEESCDREDDRDDDGYDIKEPVDDYHEGGDDKEDVCGEAPEVSETSSVRTESESESDVVTGSERD